MSPTGPNAPADTADFDADRARYSTFWRNARAGRDDACAARRRFLGAHAGTLYGRITRAYKRFVRIEQMVYEAAELVPGLVPTRTEVTAESARLQRDKAGIEVDQGILVSAILADARAGRVDLGAAEVVREGKASIVVQKNPRHLNAEDDGTLAATEIAVDLALLDPTTEVCVLRGGPVQSGRHAGRRVFGSGINLTHLYYGKIPFLWYLERDLGVVNKIYRGLAREDAPPDDVAGNTREKLWIAAVEGYAIGGHCQYLLVMDHVVAEESAYLTLPARKEGIIPGAANLRLLPISFIFRGCVGSSSGNEPRAGALGIRNARHASHRAGDGRESDRESR